MPTVTDTMVVQYFLLAGRLELLAELLGVPIVLPRVVYDPDEEDDASDLMMSEITRGVRFYRHRARTREASDDERAEALRHAERLVTIQQFAEKSVVEIADMTEQELALSGRLMSRAVDDDLPRLLPLGAGEAACLAIGIHRGFVIATDDNDALRILDHLAPGHPYERIRKLLIRAGDERRIGRQEANDLHAEMLSYGFRDTTAPFPE